MSDERPDDQPGWAAPDQPPGAPGPGQPATQPGAPPPPIGWTAPTAATAPAGVAPAVPPPQAAAGAPRRKRGMGWLVALLIGLGAILAMATAGTVLFVTRTLPPYNAADDFLSAVKRGDDNAATSRLCSADSGDAQRAIQIVRDVMSNAKSVSPNPLGVDRSDNSGRVDFTVTYNGSKSSQSYVLPMVKEGGSWKACPP
jgi:hypothetical protein